MYYMIVGGLIGGVGTYVFCKLTDKNFNNGYLAISEGEILTVIGIVIGCSIGLGYGIEQMIDGHHAF